MMRRKNTRRRVQALSSDSPRSDEIAATDMALSRVWSRDGVSDMRVAVHGRGSAVHRRVMASRLDKINWPKAAVTAAIRGGKVGTVQNPVCCLPEFHHMAIKFGRPIEMRDA